MQYEFSCHAVLLNYITKASKSAVHELWSLFSYESFVVVFIQLRHWFNRVPGPVLGIACLPSALTLTLAVPTYP